jgi:sodium/bile acid cotransporter 7
MIKKLDGFILGLILMIALAYWFPGIGDKNSTIPLEPIANIGISLIFFFYGLKLSPQNMKKGLGNYKLHLIIQLTTFLLFPVIVILTKPFIKTDEQEMLWLALFFMAALPSTVSSSVVMVSIAKGNVPGAIFNASISGLIGVVVTPLWVGIFLSARMQDFDFGNSIISLIIKIILPVIAGLLLNKHLGATARKYGRYLTLFDKSVILVIVYNSFSKSFTANIFSSINIYDLTALTLSIILLFIIIYSIIYLATKRFHFTTEDKITAVFCGSKKSLVHGSVMAKVLFKGMATMSIFIVPIMIYHSLQLIVFSIIAQRYRKKADT